MRADDRGGGGAPRGRREPPKKRAPQRAPAVASPPSLAAAVSQGVRRAAEVTRKPVSRRSTPTASFARPLARADAPITRAQTRARRRTDRARRKVNRRTEAPALPKLASPTSTQRAAATQLTIRSLRGQGLTPADIRAMPAAQRKRINRGLGYRDTNQRNVDIRVALAERVRQAQEVPLPDGFKYGRVSGKPTVLKRTKNPHTGAINWLPADTYAGKGTAARAVRAGKAQKRADARSGVESVQRAFNDQVDRIVNKVPPAQQEAALRRLVKQYTPAPGPRRPRTALAREGRQLAASRRSQGKPYEGIQTNIMGLDVDLTDLSRKYKGALESVTAGGYDNVAGRFVKDALSFPVGAVQAGAAIARAGRDALGPAGLFVPGLGFLTAADYALRPGAGRGGGDFEQAKALADAFTRGPLGELIVHQDPKAALASFKENPLFGVMDVAGAYGIAGRLAGGGGRLGMAGARKVGAESSAAGRLAAALGDTSRAPAALFPGSPQQVSRSYSKNAITKRLQVRSDRRTGNVIPERGPIADRLSGRTKALRQEVHEFASTQGEGVRRRGQQEVAHDLVDLVGKSAAGKIVQAVGKGGAAMAAAVVRARREGDASPIVDEAFKLDGKKLGRSARDTLAAMVEGRVEIDADMTPAQLKASIMREHDRLAEAAIAGRGEWSRAEVRLNRLQRQALKRAANDEKLLGNAPRLAAVRDRIVDMSTTIEDGLIRAGVLDRRQALIAKVRPVAVARFGYAPMSPQRRTELHEERGRRVQTYVAARREHAEADAALAKGATPARLARLERAERALGEAHVVLGKETGYAERAASLAVADRSVKAAQKRVERAERAVAKAMGGEAVKRGQRQAAARRSGEKLETSATVKAREDLAAARRSGDEVAIAAAKDALAKAETKAQSASRKKAAKKLKEARAARDAAKEQRRAARKALEEGEQLPDFNMGLQDRDGNPVTTDDVLQRMEREGVPMPGYIRQARGREAESFFRNWFRPGRRSSVSTSKRTGTATQRGGYASDWHALAESMLRRRGDLDSVQTWDRFVHDFGVVKPNGQHFKPEDVEPFLRQQGFLDFEGNPQPNMPEMVAVWAYPKAASRELVEAQQGARSLRDTVLGRIPDKVEGVVDNDVLGPAVDLRRGGALEELLNGKPDPNRRIVLMPAEQLRAFRDHQQTQTTTAGKVGNAITNTFRGTVLPFSTKWLTGNIMEAFLRMAVAGVRPTDMWRGQRVLRELKKQDEAAYERLRIRALGGLLYKSAEQLKVHSGASRFDHTSMEGIARQLERMGETQPMRAALGGLHALQHGVFRMNGWFETQSQIATLGKYARERGQEFSKSWFKATLLQEDVLQQVAKGLTGTPEQIRFARYVDETLGKYARFSPATRRIIQTIAPFLPWYLNALRFVTHTLPAKHPVLTSLIASTERVMAPDMEQMRGDVPPGDLEAAIPTGDDEYLTLARYTPFGAFTSGLDVVTDPILPQMITSFGILKYGVNFTGRELDIGDPDKKGRNIPGGKRALMALNSQLEGLLPFLQIARRLQEHGATAYDDSWIFGIHTKPDTATGGNDLPDALNRIFNPFRPVKLRPQSAASSSAAALDVLPPAERDALVREAEGIAQESTASDAEQRAIEDEARRILAAQGGG